METSLLNDPAFWLLITFAIPLIFRVPIAISLGLSALLVGWWWDMGVDMLSYNFFAGVAKVPLLAIPFFILAGFIMERAGIASRIVLLVETLVGDMTGGLAIATVGVATFWGAVSGSGPATVAALGLILIPAMVKSGYDKPFAAATVSVTSGLAIVIPPSIAFIVYGGIADVSVPALFAAGFVPGVVVASFLGISVFLTSRKKGYRGKPRTMPIRKALREAFWGVMTPVVILGGIYGGVFTPTEAAAVAIFYGLFVGIFIYRTIRFKTPSRRAEYLGRKIKRTHSQLARLLNKPEKKLLLRIADMEDELRDEACLNSFMSGYRLAQGIQQELLADQPPYSFEAEDERQACESWERRDTE